MLAITVGVACQFVSLSYSSAQAYYGEEGDPSSLKGLMKEIGNNFKAIGGSFSDANQADANATRAHRIADLLGLALDKIPEKIGRLPVPEQPVAIENFKTQIRSVIQLIEELAGDFENRKMDALAPLLNQIKEAKQKGHDLFKDEEN